MLSLFSVVNRSPFVPAVRKRPITSESPSMQGEMDLIWEHLWPAIQPGAVPANPHASAELSQKLCALALAPPQGQVSSPTAARISSKSFAVDTNEREVRSVAFRFGKSDCLFTLTDAQGTYPVTCGLEGWVQG